MVLENTGFIKRKTPIKKPGVSKALKGNQNAATPGKELRVAIRLNKEQRSLLESYLLDSGVMPTDDVCRKAIRQMLWQTFDQTVKHSDPDRDKPLII